MQVVIIITVNQKIIGTYRHGTVTKIDNDFVELDNDEIIAIKYITSIKSL